MTTTASPDTPDLGVPAADVGVAEHHRALGQAPDHHRVGSERDPVAVGEHELGVCRLVGTLDHLGGDREPAGPEAGPLVDLDVDRPDEGVTLGPGVLPGGIGQLAGEGVDEVREPVDVGRRRGSR